jgi:adenylate cyclase
VRAGLSTGQVLMFEGEDYIGTAVNQASRLCDAADVDEVLIARADLQKDYVGVREIDHETVNLRGLGEIAVVALTAERSMGGAFDTGELWTRVPYV